MIGLIECVLGLDWDLCCDYLYVVYDEFLVLVLLVEFGDVYVWVKVCGVELLVSFDLLELLLLYFVFGFCCVICEVVLGSFGLGWVEMLCGLLYYVVYVGVGGVLVRVKIKLFLFFNWCVFFFIVY